MLRLCYLLPLLLLAACAPAPGVAPSATGTPELEQLRQEQTLLRTRIVELENRLALLQSRVDEQQHQIEQAPPGTESDTATGEITEPSHIRPSGSTATNDKAEETSPTALYLKAFSNYAARRYVEAIEDFRSFLDRYPRNAFIGNAQYWLGECYYRQQLLTRAADEFGRVVTINPAGKKAPDALLRMVAIYRELNQPMLAEQALQKLLLDYPDSAAARRAGTR